MCVCVFGGEGGGRGHPLHKEPPHLISQSLASAYLPSTVNLLAHLRPVVGGVREGGREGVSVVGGGEWGGYMR